MTAPAPMHTAPRAPGMVLPPVLLWHDAEWVIGYWCEDGWYHHQDGLRVRPTAWAPLQPKPALALARRMAPG